MQKTGVSLIFLFWYSPYYAAKRLYFCTGWERRVLLSSSRFLNSSSYFSQSGLLTEKSQVNSRSRMFWSHCSICFRRSETVVPVALIRKKWKNRFQDQSRTCLESELSWSKNGDSGTRIPLFQLLCIQYIRYSLLLQILNNVNHKKLFWRNRVHNLTFNVNSDYSHDKGY